MDASTRSTGPHSAAPDVVPETFPEAEAPPRRKRRWPWLVLLALVVGGAGYAFLAGQPSEPVLEAGPEAAPVERVMRLSALDVETVTPRRLEETLRVSGSLAPGRQVPLTSQASGRVLRVEVQPGDSVLEGDVIAVLDVEDLLLQLDQQRNAIAATNAQLELSRAQLASATALAEREIGSRASVESAQSNFDALSANLAAQESQLRAIALSVEKATIIAPFSGIIATRSVEPLQSVGAGAAIATLVDISTLELQAAAPIASADMLRPGQSVAVTVEGVRSRSYEGEVLRISPLAIEGTRSIRVYIELGNEDEVLRGGMFATGDVLLASREEAIAVPAAALRADAEGRYVLVVSGGRLERRAVEIAEEWNRGRLVELASGLVPGEVIVAVRLDELVPGMAVSLGGR